MLSPGPLTDEEIEELDQFLLDAEGLEESMDISTLDGFLTAIVCGPKTIMPSEWLRWVWDMESGKDAPKFKDQAQAQRILGLLMRHMNDIARMQRQFPSADVQAAGSGAGTALHVARGSDAVSMVADAASTGLSESRLIPDKPYSPGFEDFKAGWDPLR